MILVDTSIWIDHLKGRVSGLETLVALGQVMIHPFITGELAVGDPRDWRRVIGLLRALPSARIASEAEFLDLIADERLGGTGLGFVDVHLLTSCRIAGGQRVWSHDKRLARFAKSLGVGWDE